MGVQDLFGDGVIGAQLQPSLSQRLGEASPGRAASAFALEPLLDAGVVVGCGSHLLSRVELRVIVRGGERGQDTRWPRSIPRTWGTSAGRGSGVSMVSDTRR